MDAVIYKKGNQRWHDIYHSHPAFLNCPNLSHITSHGNPPISIKFQSVSLQLPHWDHILQSYKPFLWFTPHCKWLLNWSPPYKQHNSRAFQHLRGGIGTKICKIAWLHYSGSLWLRNFQTISSLKLSHLLLRQSAQPWLLFRLLCLLFGLEISTLKSVQYSQ